MLKIGRQGFWSMPNPIMDSAKLKIVPNRVKIAYEYKMATETINFTAGHSVHIYYPQNGSKCI